MPLKKILITGANSYIGTSFEKYMKQFNDYKIDTLDMLNSDWKKYNFSEYDVVFHVAGVAHQKETKENEYLYYEVNRDLAIDVAKHAKEQGVKQFILLSSMSVYGKNVGYITKESLPSPKSAYARSKYDADVAITKIQTNNFKIAILRPPMVYGKGCKGNYQSLRKFALMSPLFPKYDNRRSMIYIGNLCVFVKFIIDEERYGLFLPQNSEYVNTSDMVKRIATKNRKNIFLVSIFNPCIKLLSVSIIKKVFGTLIYEQVDLVDTFSFEKSIDLTERI